MTASSPILACNDRIAPPSPLQVFGRLVRRYPERRPAAMSPSGGSSVGCTPRSSASSDTLCPPFREAGKRQIEISVAVRVPGSRSMNNAGFA